MVEAENDRLYHQVNALGGIVDEYAPAEDHEHVTELVKASFRSEGHLTVGRDLEQFGRLYSLRNQQEAQLAAALDALMTEVVNAVDWMQTSGNLTGREPSAIEYRMATVNYIERSTLGCIVCVDDICVDQILSYVGDALEAEVPCANYENAQAFLALYFPAKNYDPNMIEFSDLNEDTDGVGVIPAFREFVVCIDEVGCESWTLYIE
jgi:hypothetical protein